jgi:hypothetical protein
MIPESPNDSVKAKLPYANRTSIDVSYSGKSFISVCFPIKEQISPRIMPIAILPKLTVKKSDSIIGIVE